MEGFALASVLFSGAFTVGVIGAVIYIYKTKQSRGIDPLSKIDSL